MALKRYQERVVESVRAYLKALRYYRDSEDEENRDNAPSRAWNRVTPQLNLSRMYHWRNGGDGREMAHFAIKVPTGGGKTLLATQMLADAHRLLLPERNGAGLVLWVVPTDQIYTDLLKALRDRKHMLRQSLEIALSRRVEVWEKGQIQNLSPAQMAENLNVLVLKLQGTNRQDRESLKFFRDSGGPITRHFPPEDDWEAHRKLKQQIPNWDLIEFEGTEVATSKTSLANLVRLHRPVVILDESHKAASKLALETIEGFNPALLIEMSATVPDRANVLAHVSGQELLEEEMIKLPINLVSASGTSWQQCLTQAHDRRDALAGTAQKYFEESRELIRPIVLVQVERVGRDQRTGGFIHAEDVREYLTQHLGVPPNRVRVKTAEVNEILDENLMASDSPVEWIITKSALQEGWDCPFAYVLVSLNNSQSKTGLTQLVGRVLRQPFQRKTTHEELNESYVYCLHSTPVAVIKEIRDALSKEGYEGQDFTVRDDSGLVRTAPRMATMREEVRSAYRQPEGEIYLPYLAVKECAESEAEKLDPFRHLHPDVDWRSFNYKGRWAEWNWLPALRASKEHFYRVHLNSDALAPLEQREVAWESLATDEAAKAWMVANLRIDWISAKRLRWIVEEACHALQPQGGESIEGKLALLRFKMIDDLRVWIENAVDEKAEARFEAMMDAGKIVIDAGLRRLPHQERKFRFNTTYRFPDEVPLNARPLLRADHSPIQNALFVPVGEDGNQYEITTMQRMDEEMDGVDGLYWWVRNTQHGTGYWLQGPRRARIFPDYVASTLRKDQGPMVFIVETKGRHLEDNKDTQYKQKVAGYFNRVAHTREWQSILDRRDGTTHSQCSFRFEVVSQGVGDGWREEVARLLAEGKGAGLDKAGQECPSSTCQKAN